MYRQVGETWRKIRSEKAGGITERIVKWRRERTILRLEKPSRIDRARRLGYKAKQGFVVVRVRVGRGGMRRKRPRAGRRPKHLGVVRMKADISVKKVAEGRAARKFPNLKVLNSYFLYQDGKYAWYEVLFVDPHHPSVAKDKNIDWVSAKA